MATEASQKLKPFLIALAAIVVVIVQAPNVVRAISG